GRAADVVSVFMQTAADFGRLQRNAARAPRAPGIDRTETMDDGVRAMMSNRGLIGSVALAATMSMALAPARAADELRYPDLNGQWSRAHAHSQWDPSKPRGLAQQAPLTPEYQAIFEANLASLHAGNLGADPQVFCLPS